MKNFFLFAILLFVFATPQTKTFALVDPNQKPTIPETQQFVADEIIIKYKPNQSPDDLAIELQKKQTRKKTIVGFFQVLFEDLSAWAQKQETIETKIQRLEEADTKAGVLEKKQLFPNPPPELAHIYLLKLKNNNAKEVIDLYKNLKEIDYAELNQIVHTMQ